MIWTGKRVEDRMLRNSKADDIPSYLIREFLALATRTVGFGLTGGDGMKAKIVSYLPWEPPICCSRLEAPICFYMSTGRRKLDGRAVVDLIKMG